MASHNQGHHCCSQTQPTKESHIETKIEGLLEKFKHELEIRDIKLEHKMEMMELKMKMSLLETQQDIINKVTPRNDAPVRKSRNVENTSTRDLEADADICMEKTDDCQNMPKQIVNPCQQVQYEYQYCPILGQGKIDNTNNVYQETQHLRKVQGVDLYMTNNMLQSKINSKSKHLPPNNWDLLNDDNVLEEYYKKYPTQREVNEKRHLNRTESNATSVRKCSNTDQVNQPHEKVKEHRIDERKEFCCDQIMDNKDKNNQESQNNNNQNHLLEIGPIARKKRRKSL